MREALAANVFVRWLLVVICVAVVALALVAPSFARAEAPAAAARYRFQYRRIIHAEWGMNGPVASLAAQIHAESGWNCGAVSRVGAGGCAQFMPTTAVWIGDVDHSLKDGDLFSPTWAFRAQAVYMKWLRDRVTAANDCERMAFALSAYNGGLGYVYRRQKLSPDPRRCFARTCDINPGIAPANQRENARYPVRILRELEPLYADWGSRSCG